ncbi:SGNH/GDSL hydrolase family protein [Streptomyces thermolineatus]|uniref:SGNH/GDSL hydrolase family protein n=1 Tax=Streptomyces thermolineatus TaxID=44033 RepID=A0ABN3KUN6_9ACTN
MARKAGYALLAALVSAVILVTTLALVGTDGPGGRLHPANGAKRPPAEQASSGAWTGTWSASAVSAEPNTDDGYPDMSIRNVVHVSVGGSSARIHLSNQYGALPLVISRATVAVASAPSSPVPAAGTMRRLTFGNKATVTLPAGETAVSDPVRIDVPDSADLLVTTYSPTPSGPVTYHPFARQTSYLAHGDHAADTTGTAFTEQSPYWRYVTAVDVWSRDAEGAVVVLGDSITDGITSTAGANHRWTDFLAARLLQEKDAPRMGVLNQGISGNRILSDAPPRSPSNGVSGLNRLESDALSRTGAATLVVELGINDILKVPHQTDPDAIVGGLREITALAHERGLRVVGATLTPFGGHRGFTPRLEAVRQEVNRQIRNDQVFDAVVDFDLALRDPNRTNRLLPAYDSGDHLHPSDAGYRRMAEVVDLDRLRPPAPVVT